MEREMRREVRPISSKFTTREDGEQLFIEGYFAVFNSNYEIAPGLTESIAPGAFSSSLSNDVRALVNHDTTLVLGRTAAHTLELRQDEHGLWGIVQVNPKDTDISIPRYTIFWKISDNLLIFRLFVQMNYNSVPFFSFKTFHFQKNFCFFSTVTITSQKASRSFDHGGASETFGFALFPDGGTFKKYAHNFHHCRPESA